MNYKVILRSIGAILFLEAFFFLPSVGLSIYDGDMHVLKAFLFSMAIMIALGALLVFPLKNKARPIYAREGFLLVGIAWIVASGFGALPFYLSGEIASYVDAFFETVSGFTTTGSSILQDPSIMSRALLLWRSFTHWLGGMGILVFMLALMPSTKGKGESLYVLRAESPGPSIEKITPKIHRHAITLYGIYISLSIMCFLALYLGGMPFFDSVCTMFGTAGTGGFGVKADSLASYTILQQRIVMIFLVMFGINFNIYFLLLLRKIRTALKDEELRAYLGILAFSIIVIVANNWYMFSSVGESVHHSAFAVINIMTTAGFVTKDFNVWPQFSKQILLCLMVIGASAGSTGGGIKVSRLLIILKAAYREIRKALHSRSVILVRINERKVPDATVQGVYVFLVIYALIAVSSVLLISLDNFSLETNLSAVLSCLGNIGPGMDVVGPTGNFKGFSAASKIILSFDMLLGRLEIFPLLILFHYKTWRKHA